MKIFNSAFILITMTLNSCSNSKFSSSTKKTEIQKNGDLTKQESDNTPEATPGIISSSVTTPLDQGCFSDAFQGKTYIVCKGQKSKTESQSYCENLKLQLAKVDSEEENRWIVDTAIRNNGCADWQTTSYWISNTLNSTPPTWPSNSAIWAPREPLQNAQDIHIMRYCESPYGWNDLDSNDPGAKFGWICKSK